MSLFFYHEISLLEKCYLKLCIASFDGSRESFIPFHVPGYPAAFLCKWCFNDLFFGVHLCLVYIHVIYHVHVTCRQGTLGDKDGIALQGRSEKHTPFYSYYEYSQDTDKYAFINKFV